MKYEKVIIDYFATLNEQAGGPPPPPGDPGAVPPDAEEVAPPEGAAVEAPVEPPVEEPPANPPSDIQQVRLSGAERLRRALTMTRDEIDDQDFAMLGVEVTPSNLDKMEKDLHRIIDSYPEVDAGRSGPGVV